MRKYQNNKYIVHFNDGNILEIFATTMSGAVAQVHVMEKFISNIERIYKTGKRAVCPW